MRVRGVLNFSRCIAAIVMAVCALVFASPGYAEGVKLANVKLESNEDGIQLNADFELALANTLMDTVRRGVPLYFVVEFEMTRGRWYWLDDVLVKATRERRVSYAPLTEQYRVSTAGVSQNVSSIEDVRRVLARVRSWTIAERGKLKPGEKYAAGLRFRLDTAQLPKPFQLNTFGAREWNLSSDWHRWTVTVNKDGSIAP
jgi:ribosomal protein L29